MPSGHIVLLGDSIFDNRAYTGREPEVVSHLRSLLPAGWRASLCAVDGATTGSLRRQLEGVPADATHLVVSIGGNDALQHADLLSMRVRSSADTLMAIADRVAGFEHAYRAAIGAVHALGRSLTVCTIYNGALEPDQATAARIALAVFNDAITRTAIDLRVDLLELRSVCTERADYANPIEPSGRGGLKIAHAIAHAVGATGAGDHATRAWGARPSGR